LRKDVDSVCPRLECTLALQEPIIRPTRSIRPHEMVMRTGRRPS
jgi:hypothetical protein